MERRIRPDHIERAYHLLQMPVCRHGWLCHGNDSVECLCPMGLVLMAHDPLSFYRTLEDIEALAQERYGLPYTEGFISAVDSEAPHEGLLTSERYRQGRHDGYRAVLRLAKISAKLCPHHKRPLVIGAPKT